MTEERAREICKEHNAVFSIKKRRNTYYVYVARWLPRRVTEAAGYKVSASTGQSFDRYVCAVPKLAELSEETLRQRIDTLPINPNKTKSKANT